MEKANSGIFFKYWGQTIEYKRSLLRYSFDVLDVPDVKTRSKSV